MGGSVISGSVHHPFDIGIVSVYRTIVAELSAFLRSFVRLLVFGCVHPSYAEAG